MQVRIIGGSGGVTKSTSATSYLIDGCLLIDAGSAASGLDLSEQVALETILISHAHLDHTKDLAFLCDNCFGTKKTPFQVYTHKSTLKAIKDHLFNDVIWPDFSVLPSEEEAVIKFNTVDSEKPFKVGPYEITPVLVKHPGDAIGFVIEKKGDCALLFTQDTAPTERIWEVSKSFQNIKGIFTEVSFPNSLQKVADISDHHTPKTMKEEMKKMPPSVPIYLGHLKPGFYDKLKKEISDIDDGRITVMDKDQMVFNF